MTDVEIINSDAYKQCSACGQFKLRNDFYDDQAAEDGKQNRCKICVLVGATREHFAKVEVARDR